MQHPSILTRALSAGVAGLVLSGLGLAQIQQTDGVVAKPAPQSVLQAFHTTKATLQDLSVPQQNIQGFEVEIILGGKSYTMVLRENDVRTKDYKLIVSDQNGLRTIPTPANTTYAGTLTKADDSGVAMTLVAGQLEGLIRMSNGDLWSVQPLTKSVPNANRATHVVHHGKHSNAPKGTCGVPGGLPAVEPKPQVGFSGGPIYECEIACDADFEFYKANSSNTTNTENNVKGVINALNVIYKRDCEIEHKITTIIVRTSQTYTRNNYSYLLTDFRSRWISSHGGIRRDVAHLFTAKSRVNSVIGVAYLRGICSTSIGYGLSFTNFTSNFNSRVGLTAHELGHNWGSNHCSGSSCFIMCAGLGGCGRSLTKFSTGVISTIVSFRNGRSCLTKQQGGLKLTSLTPSTVPVFRAPTVKITGTGLTGTTRVNVGGKKLDAPFGFRILSDTELTFVPPTAASLFPSKVSVEGPSGKSNELTLSFTTTSPPKLDAFSVPARGQLMLWEFASFPAHNWILTVSPSPTTFKFLNMDWLSTPILLFGGTLNNAGYGQATVNPVPTNLTVGLKFYSQVITIDPIANKLAGNTNVELSTIR